MPKKEGKPRSVNSIQDIWRVGTPRCVLLLDNDFFGQDAWRDRIGELREGRFKVSFNQGINIRMITDETAEAIASVEYRDDNFRRRRLYVAWDNLRDEQVFFAGLERLNAAGIPSRHVMVYMLVGYKPSETMEEVLYRFNRLRDAGCKPYPIVYERWRQPELEAIRPVGHRPVPRVYPLGGIRDKREGVVSERRWIGLVSVARLYEVSCEHHGVLTAEVCRYTADQARRAHLRDFPECRHGVKRR